jgi:anti-sigma regulatory factor (Ser/Thr protein kinase)
MERFDITDHQTVLTLCFASSFSHVDRAVDAIMAFIKRHGVPIEEFDLYLILREGLNNAVEHGNKFDLSRCVRCRLEVQDTLLHIRIEDEGEGFDWQHRQPFEIDALTERGKGLLLMEAYGFEVEYNSKGNVLSLWKHCEKSADEQGECGA